MNSATHTVVLGNNGETVTFTMSEKSTKVGYKNSRGEAGSISRKAAQVEIAQLVSAGWRP